MEHIDANDFFIHKNRQESPLFERYTFDIINNKEG